VTEPGLPSPIFNPFNVTAGIKQKGVDVTKASSASYTSNGLCKKPKFF
jgi:hypothetical protein